MFDILKIQYNLENGFRIGKTSFMPEAFLTSVEEPEFGCEGRPEGETVYGRIDGITIKGLKTWKLEEKLMENSGLDDMMWIGRIQDETGSKKLVLWREGMKSCREIGEDIWAARQEMESDQAD